MTGPGAPSATLPRVRGAPLRAFVVAVLCTAALPGCTAAAQDDGPSPDQAEADPSAADARATPPPARPFELTVERITVVGMDNAAILGRRGTPAASAVAEQAVAAARDVLAAFLDAQLAAEDTRFSAGPIDHLLSPRARAALTDEDRAGLGQAALPVGRTITGPASTVAQVLVDGDRAHAVTLSYNALLTVVLEDGTSSPAKQSGAMTFVPTDEGWRADAVEVTTDLPEASP